VNYHGRDFACERVCVCFCKKNLLAPSARKPAHLRALTSFQELQHCNSKVLMFNHESDRVGDMEQLQHAIQEAGGVTALAKELGITQPRVSNWIARGVPDGWMAVLSLRWPLSKDAATATSRGEAKDAA
jgi:hypothetical protein